MALDFSEIAAGLNNIEFGSYFKENTSRVNYQDQLIVFQNNRSSFRESHRIHKFTPSAKLRVIER
jgi:hypothetical protein